MHKLFTNHWLSCAKIPMSWKRMPAGNSFKNYTILFNSFDYCRDIYNIINSVDEIIKIEYAEDPDIRNTPVSYFKFSTIFIIVKNFTFYSVLTFR